MGYLPRIFGTEDVFLTIFSPAIAIVWPFKPGLRADFHLICPLRQHLPANSRKKIRNSVFQSNPNSQNFTRWLETHLFLDVSLLSNCSFTAKPRSKSSLWVLPLTESGDAGTLVAPTVAVETGGGWHMMGPLHLRIRRDFSYEFRMPWISTSRVSAVDPELRWVLSCLARFAPWISSLISVFCSQLHPPSIDAEVKQRYARIDMRTDKVSRWDLWALLLAQKDDLQRVILGNGNGYSCPAEKVLDSEKKCGGLWGRTGLVKKSGKAQPWKDRVRSGICFLIVCLWSRGDGISDDEREGRIGLEEAGRSGNGF